MQTNPIRAFRAKAFTVRIGTPTGVHDVLKIAHNRDGSFFVAFLWACDPRGIVAVCTMPPGPPPKNLSLTERGRATSHLIKYTHHESGVVHFSQTGKVRTEVRRIGVPLEGFEGHLWTCQLHGLANFRKTKAPRAAPISPKDQVLTFDYPDATVDSFKITAFMYRGDRLRQRLSSESTGPVLRAVDPQGKVRPSFLTAAPTGWKGEQRAFVIIGEPIASPSGERAAKLTFAGGFDVEAIVNDLSVSMSFLAFAYPVSDFESLVSNLGTIDLPR